MIFNPQSKQPYEVGMMGTHSDEKAGLQGPSNTPKVTWSVHCRTGT